MAARRVVLDTSVIASAFRSRTGASSALMGLVADRQLIMLATTELFLEYEDVLKRPEQRAVSGLTAGQIDAILRVLSAALEPVIVRFSWRPQLRDADDEMVLDAAINGRAEALITHNLADFAAAAPLLRVPVIAPGAFLREIMT